MAQASKAYKQWQKDAYHRCQALSAQEGALPDLIRQSIKAAHFCELTHSWCVLQPSQCCCSAVCCFWRTLGD